MIDDKKYPQFPFFTRAKKYCISLLWPMTRHVKVDSLYYLNLHGVSLTSKTYMISYVLWTKLAIKTVGYSAE